MRVNGKGKDVTDVTDGEMEEFSAQVSPAIRGYGGKQFFMLPHNLHQAYEEFLEGKKVFAGVFSNVDLECTESAPVPNMSGMSN